MPHRLSWAADQDLLQIYLHGADEFGIAAADRYAAWLRKAFDILGENPQLARRREALDGDVRAYPVRSHIIIDEIDGEGTVFALRIRHGGEDWLQDVY
jgi:toxin ParE1/3/4